MALGNSVQKGGGNVFLPHQFIKTGGAVLTGGDLIALHIDKVRIHGALRVDFRLYLRSPIQKGVFLKIDPMNQYETVLILTPVLTEEMVREAVLKFEKVLKENGAELVHQAHWGLRKLAYPIRKKATGFYHLYEFKATGLAVDKLELELRRDERILRFLTVSLDKYAVTYNESRRRPKTAKEEVNP